MVKKKRGRPALDDEPSSAVSMRGNRSFRLALRELAARRNQSIADLVRDAVDKTYGEELEPLTIFFEESGLIEVRKVS